MTVATVRICSNSESVSDDELDKSLEELKLELELESEDSESDDGELGSDS